MLMEAFVENNNMEGWSQIQDLEKEKDQT